MVYSVCIPTYKRPIRLTKLLENIYIQRFPDNCLIEVIIVDNDPDESAREISSSFSSSDEIKIKYFTQPIKNISITRNKLVTEASGEVLFFIDDDSIPSKDWIMSFLIAFEEYNADILIGKAIFEFESDVPIWIHDYFHKNQALSPSGSVANKFYIGNCAIKSALIKKMGDPFDLKYGILGGEDSDLFRRLQKEGAKILACNEAIVKEYVPLKNSNALWLIKRSFRQGYLFTDNLLSNKYNLVFFSRLFNLLKSLLFFIISLLLTLFSFKKNTRFYWATKIASNIGHFFAAVLIPFPKSMNDF